MSDNDVYLPSATSTESCDTSYWSSKQEMKVASTVQPFEGELRASNEDLDEERQRRFLARGVQVKIRTKNFRHWMFCLLRLCFIFYGEIYVKNGQLCSFLLP